MLSSTCSLQCAPRAPLNSSARRARPVKYIGTGSHEPTELFRYQLHVRTPCASASTKLSLRQSLTSTGTGRYIVWTMDMLELRLHPIIAAQPHDAYLPYSRSRFTVDFRSSERVLLQYRYDITKPTAASRRAGEVSRDSCGEKDEGRCRRTIAGHLPDTSCLHGASHQGRDTSA